jgi:hypothetical protein
VGYFSKYANGKKIALFSKAPHIRVYTVQEALVLCPSCLPGNVDVNERGVNQE